MTRITPHQQHIANKAAMAMSRTDIKCSIGYCAIPTAKVQLLALRYGLIEPGAATDNTPAPYSLKTRPVGLRRQPPSDRTRAQPATSDQLLTPDAPPHEGLHTVYNAKADMKRQSRALHELYPDASTGQLFACVQALQTPADS